MVHCSGAGVGRSAAANHERPRAVHGRNRLQRSRGGRGGEGGGQAYRRRGIEDRDPAVGQAALAVLRVVVTASILALLLMIVALAMVMAAVVAMVMVVVMAMVAVSIRVLDRTVVMRGQAIVQGQVQARAELEADHPKCGDQAGNRASVPGRKHSDPGHTPGRAVRIAALRAATGEPPRQT
jgi:hypothetical protein